jgi:hypothetical protein
MSDRRLALTIVFGDIGSGTVINNLPDEALAEPNPTGIISPCPAGTAVNVRLYEGMAERRPGYATFSTAKAASEINSIYVAAFDPITRFLLRGHNTTASPGGGVERYDEAANSWAELTPVGNNGNGLADQPWHFAMVPSPTLFPANILMFANAASDIFTWDGSGGANSAVALTDSLAPTAPHASASFLSRAFVLNVTTPEGDRVGSRLQWSAVGDARDWSSLGAGNLDIDSDPFPGVALMVLGGRLIVFKGGKDGGAIYVCTPTGVSTAPLRVDAINPDLPIGPIVPRSVIPISPTTAFFLGHDAVYLYDGVRALLPFAEGVARDITSRLNLAALDTGFAYYDRTTRTIQLFVATGAFTTPSEVWHFDVRTRRAYGPMSLEHNMLHAATWVSQGALSWDTMGQAAGRQWDTLTNTAGAQYFQWDRIVEGSVAETTLYGDTIGQLYQSDGSQTDDAGTNISCNWTSPAITPKGWVSARNVSSQPGARRWRDNDEMALRSVTIRHRATVDWVPVVEINTSGAAWTKISDDTTAAATGGGGRLIPKTYTVNNLAPSPWYQLRVRNTTGDGLSLRDVTLEFTYAGSSRHK